MATTETSGFNLNTLIALITVPWQLHCVLPLIMFIWRPPAYLTVLSPVVTPAALKALKAKHMSNMSNTTPSTIQVHQGRFHSAEATDKTITSNPGNVIGQHIFIFCFVSLTFCICVVCVFVNCARHLKCSHKWYNKHFPVHCVASILLWVASRRAHQNWM